MGSGLVAHPARFERATFRLGGGCSIQLSYRRIFALNCTLKLRKCQLPNNILHIFYSRRHIVLGVCQKGGFAVSQQEIDLDDLIFEESDGLPSER